MQTKTATRKRKLHPYLGVNHHQSALQVRRCELCSVITKSLPKARNSLECGDKLYSKTKREEPFSRLGEIIASFPCVWFRLKITSESSGKSTVLSKRIRKLPRSQVVG